MATLSQWIDGARPRTLPAAVAPIAAGTGAAAQVGSVVWAYAILAVVVALALQVGVNYANDYSDGIRGTDEERVGPVRLVGQRLASPSSVKIAAFASFFFAGLCGLALVALSGAWIMIPIGALAIVAAWYYTGGENPYGYLGLGEVFVFVFFGLVATVGTTLTMVTPDHPSLISWYAAIGVGAIASALLVANNLRDIPTDREHGKRTLAVRMGDRATRWFYLALIAVAFVMTGLIAGQSTPWVYLSLLAAPLIVKPLQAVLGGGTGKGLIPALAGTGLFEVAWAILLAVGLFLSAP